MAKQLEFYFDYGSPTTYLAWTQLPGLAERTGAEIVWQPMLLGGVFKLAGNHTPVEIELKAKWMMEDMARFADRYGVPFKMNPYFIINTLPLMRGAVYALREGFLPAYNEAVFRAIWVDEKNMGDPEVIGAVLTDAGLDTPAIFAAAQESEVKQELIDRTEKAVARGIFGAPCIFVGDDLFFGQDRLDFVEEALAA